MNVKVKEDHKLPDWLFWLTPEEYLKSDFGGYEIAWWDRAQLRTYILRQ